MTRTKTKPGIAKGLAIGLLLLAGPAMAQAPGIDPPVYARAELAVAEAAGTQGNSWVSAGGAGFLAVWTDARSTVPHAWLETETGDDVYAMRLDAAGQPLDAAPLVLSADFGHQRYPRAAWNGSSWLVIWADQKPSGFYHAQHVYGIRVAPDGALLDPEPFPIIRYESSSSLYIDLTARGSEWLIVTQGTSSGEGGIVGVRVAADGSVLDDPPLMLVSQGVSLFSNISVQSAGDEYLLVYVESSYTYGERLSSDLTPIASRFPLPGSKVASSGSEYYVAWWEGSDIVGSPMSVDGALAFPNGVLVTTDHSAGFMVNWSGTQWWVMWLQFVEEIKLARVDTSGVVLDPGGFQLDATPPDEIQQPYLSDGSDGSVVVLWTQYDMPGLDPNDVRGTHVSANGVPGSDVAVSTGAPMQLRPELVRGPGHFLLASRGQRSGMRQLFVQRLDGEGQPLDPAPRLVAEDPYLGPHAAAWNGSLYLVVWAQDGDVHGQRFDASLDPLDAEPFRIMGGTSPDLAALNGDFLVVATKPTTSIHFYVPFARRVGGDGSLLDPQEFSIGAYFTRVPRVAAIAGRWLAVWQRNYSHDDTQAEVNGAWIYPDGSLDPYFTVAYDAYEPEIAYSGARALIAYRRGSDAAANSDVAARIMVPDGSMPEPEFSVSAANDRQSAPHVAWDGENFLMAWQDRREAESFIDERSDIYAARITESGSLLDMDSFPVASGPNPSIQPNIVSADGHTLIGAALFDTSQGLTTYRVATFRLDGGPTSPPRADFSAAATYGCLPLNVPFTDLSVGAADSWEWSFGDGGSSSFQDPVHTYAQSGVYSVYMTARGPGGADTALEQELITVSGGIDADFSSSTVSGCAPLEVSFEDLSTGYPTNWTWNFGDDSFSNEQHPNHTYRYPGTYTVEMTAAGCGSSTETKMGLITIEGMCPNSSLAHSETPVYGTMTNDYTWTHASDGYNQVLQEETFGGGPNVSTRMEHRWHFTVAQGVSVDFHADIFPYAAYFETLAFEYATDGQTFLPLATVDDYNVREVDAALPANVSGEVTIRLYDMDRGKGDDFRNTVNVNHLRIDSGVAEPAHDCEAITGLGFTSKEQLDWHAGASSTHYDVLRGDVGMLRANGGIGDGDCAEDDLLSTSHTDIERPAPGAAFYYVIRGDAEARTAGTYDNPPGTAAPDEERDREAGSAGGSSCANRP